MKKKDVNREVILVDDQWNIVGHSATAHTAIGSNMRSLLGVNMRHLSPHTHFETLENCDKFTLDNSAQLVFRQKKNVSVYMRYFLVYLSQAIPEVPSPSPSSAPG